jgi:FMN phosphatase YigB (HAD superfamily)
MVVSGVLFDLCGTLVWPEPPGEVLFCEACQLLGFQVDPCDLFIVITEMDHHVPLPITRKEEADFFAYGNMTALQKLGYSATLSHGWFIYNYINDRIQYHKFGEVDIVLSRLRKAGLRLGLIANAVPSVRDRIHKLSLDMYFHIIVLSGEVGYEVPEPEIFQVAVDNLSLLREETVYVGDNYADIVGAHEAGITPVLLDRNKRYTDLDCVNVKNLTEFQEMISIFE